MKPSILLVALLALTAFAEARTPRKPKPEKPAQEELSAFDLLQAAWTEATGDTATLVLQPSAAKEEGSFSSDEMTVGGADPMERINGKVNNVEIISGRGVNDDAVIRFRNAPSILSASAPPLYVIDGAVGADPHSISEQDIESVTILRDAEAIAEYGMRGANGVVVVKTKRAK